MNDTFTLSEGKYNITVHVEYIGDDVLVIISGGDKAHIGSVSMSIYRKSLESIRDGSSTTSTLNVLGHKDNYIADAVSSYLSKELKKNVVCTCGIHVNNATKEDIDSIMTYISVINNKIINITK